MTMPPADCRTVAAPAAGAPGEALDRVLRIFSVVTMLMTLPQVIYVWAGRNTEGVSVVSWATYLVSACLWLVYGLRKRDKTIYVPCIGWIVLDAAVVVGVLAHG